MVENTRRSYVESNERGTPLPQWDVFVREERVDPLRHAGSVAAIDATDAYDHATELFGWDACDIWLCPADALERYSKRPLEAHGDEDEENEECERKGDEEEIDDSSDDEADDTPQVTDDAHRVTDA